MDSARPRRWMKPRKHCLRWWMQDFHPTIVYSRGLSMVSARRIMQMQCYSFPMNL
uniref:Uncharacterized protein n=1 Tax=Arundo donax TaxID=35708 RepID=A0A0A9HMX6_ARUDO